MPRHLISDAHEWINEIPTVPIYYLAKPQPRERAWQNQRGKKTLEKASTGSIEAAGLLVAARQLRDSRNGEPALGGSPCGDSVSTLFRTGKGRIERLPCYRRFPFGADKVQTIP